LKIEVVKYYWREWYVRVTYTSGRTWHSEPLNTELAADIMAAALARPGNRWMMRNPW